MNQTLNDIKTRRSVKAFRPEIVDDQLLDQVLEAGTWAASGMGKQPSVIVVVKDKQTICQLSQMTARIMGTVGDPFYGAPVVLIVLADRTRPTAVEDGALVLGNMMLAAHALGVGSCWIHRAREEFDSPEGKALLEKWGVHGSLVGIGHLAIGYAAGKIPAPKPRKPDYIVRT
ncbi:MAG: nitroreductase [Clostridia bacterium]